MAYIPKEWKDLPDETTPIQASDLNHIEKGIGDLNTSVSNLNTSIGDLNTLNTTEKSNLVGAINEVYQNNVYSTEEIIIGKWIDGKNLYRKIYQINNPSGTQSIIDISNLNADLCWVNTSHSFLKTSTSEPEFKTLNYFESNQGYYIYANTIMDPYRIVVNYTDSVYFHGTVYIEINYTKTTD